MTNNAPTAQSGSAASTLAQGVEPMLAIWRSNCLEMPVTIVSEVTKFASHRLRVQSDYLARLQGCKTLSDVLEANASFLQTMSRDYAEESGRIAGQLTKVSDARKAA